MKTRPDPYQSIVKKIHSNDNNYNSHHHGGGGISSMSSDRANPTAAIMHLRKGLSLYDAQEEFSASSLSSSSSLASSSPSVFESNWKISEIVNPDGSKTVRRKVLSKDGLSYDIVEEQVIKSPEHTSFSSSVSSLSPGFPPPTTSKLQLQTKYWYHYRMRNGQSFTESRSLAPDAFGTDPFQVVKPAATAATAAAAALSQESAMSSLSSSSPHATTKPLHQDTTNDSFSGIESVLDGQDSILDGEAPPKSQRAPVAPGEEQQQQRVGNSVRKKPVTPKSKVQSVFVSPQLQTNTNKNKHVVTVVKKEMGESLGISVGVRDFLDGPPRLVVSKIGKTSKLRLTPLAAGDVVESINDISFIVDDPNPEAAFEIVRNSKTITFVVRKPQPIKQHPKPHSKQKKVTLTDIPDLSTMQNEKSESKRDHEFDEDSYDASLNGYQSCKIVQFPKLDPQEDVGLTLETKHTKWGRLLLVSEISPFSKLHYSGLQVGDAVLEINSFCFRETPDADIANGLLKEAWGDVVIEYQPLSHMTTTTNSPTTPSSSSSKDEQQPAPAEPQPESRITESVKFDGARCIRTEQVNPDGSTSIKIEELPPSALRNKDKTKKSTTVTMEQPSQFIPEINPHHNHHSNVATIMVRKQSPSDDVGIILAKAKDEGFLFVTKVSPTGLLAGKPVLPGDKILSINDKDFRSHRNKPSVQDAYAEIRNAPSTVTFKLAKRSTPKKTKKSNSSSKKQQQEQRRKREIEEQQHKTKFCERFSCSGRRKQVESKQRSDRSLSSSSSSYASASTKGKTSEYQNALYI